MPQAWDSLKVFVSISFVVLSKFYFSKLYIILFTRDRTFVVRGARVKVYKVLIYRYNFIFSTKEGLFLQTISVSFILIAIKLIDLKDRIATHIAAFTLYIVLQIVHFLDPPATLMGPLFPLLPHCCSVNSKVASLLFRHHLEAKHEGSL